MDGEGILIAREDEGVGLITLAVSPTIGLATPRAGPVSGRIRARCSPWRAKSTRASGGRSVFHSEAIE